MRPQQWWEEEEGRRLEAQCAAWNRAHGIGTGVRYQSVIGIGKPLDTRTRSQAYVLSGHTPVVFVEGVAGCVALDHCEYVGEAQ